MGCCQYRRHDATAEAGHGDLRLLLEPAINGRITAAATEGALGRPVTGLQVTNGYTQLMQGRTLEFSAVGAVDFQSRNDATDYRNGAVMRIDALMVRRYDNGSGVGLVAGAIHHSEAIPFRSRLASRSELRAHHAAESGGRSRLVPNFLTGQNLNFERVEALAQVSLLGAKVNAPIGIVNP